MEMNGRSLVCITIMQASPEPSGFAVVLFNSKTSSLSCFNI